MSPEQEKPSPNMQPDKECQGDIYHVRVQGRLDSEWFQDWFEGFTIRPMSDGTCLISGPVRDQAELFGLLCSLRDAGLRLIALECSPRKPED